MEIKDKIWPFIKEIVNKFIIKELTSNKKIVSREKLLSVYTPTSYPAAS